MAIPYRGWTGHDTYFVTASTAGKRGVLQSERMAGLFIENLYHYREQGKYLLHEFVVMPNHFHLLLTPAVTLERSLQLIKGGFSYRARKELHFIGDIWEGSFHDRRVRDAAEYERLRNYIRKNPVRARLPAAEQFRFSFANPNWVLDEVPQRLKPVPLAAMESQS